MIKRVLQNTTIKGLPYSQRIPKIININKGLDDVNKLNITDSDIFGAQSIYYLAQILSGSDTDFSALTKKVTTAESNIATNATNITTNKNLFDQFKTDTTTSLSTLDNKITNISTVKVTTYAKDADPSTAVEHTVTLSQLAQALINAGYLTL